MNIIIKLSDLLNNDDSLKETNIQFLNSKRNITMDGEFTKILYSTPCFSLDSLFIECPLQIQSDPHFFSKTELSRKNGFIQQNTISNGIIKRFTELEKRLLDYYRTYKNSNKKPVYLLSNHFSNGNVKIFTTQGNDRNVNQTNKIYGIKLSGIWESYDSIGITYKIIETYKNF